MFDTLLNPFVPCFTQELPAAEPFPAVPILAAVWEEHCVECAMPLCYRNCPKFEKALDGRCRRLHEGVARTRLANGEPAYQLAFKDWGKLEFAYRGLWTTRNRATRMLLAADRVGESCARALRRLLPFLPWHRNPVSVYRHLRKSVLGLWRDRMMRPVVWRGFCWAEREEKLVCAIATARENRFEQRLELVRGWNRFEFVLPPIPDGAFFRLYPPRGGTGHLVFYRFEITGEKTCACPAPFVKCVAWDLDGTLWRGVVSEDANAVHVREEVISCLRALDARGILNTIVSKNDFETAWRKVRDLGLSDYFLMPQINWDPKSLNLSRVAHELNLGLDAFALVDDAPYERGEVRAHCPAVRLYTENDIPWFLSEPCMNPPQSAESASRRAHYRAELKRREAFFASGLDLAAFVRDSKLELDYLAISTPELRRRCWELVQRTNRLTLAGRRYSEDEFEGFLSEIGRAYAVRCRDRYGDYGIVGFIALDVKDGCAYVREFVMSCRVANKGCEEMVLRHVWNEAKAVGAREFDIRVVPTGRNDALLSAVQRIEWLRK